MGLIASNIANAATPGYKARDIDCAAATGSEFGRVGILRLDDGAEFYANINPGD